MLYRVIDTDELSSLIRGFMDDYEFIAPVKADRGYVFEVVDDPSKVELDYVTTITSPKKYFLPSEEVLMRYFQEKLDRESDRLWDEGVLNQEVLDEIRKEDLHKK